MALRIVLDELLANAHLYTRDAADAHVDLHVDHDAEWRPATDPWMPVVVTVRSGPVADSDRKAEVRREGAWNMGRLLMEEVVSRLDPSRGRIERSREGEDWVVTLRFDAQVVVFPNRSKE